MATWQELFEAASNVGRQVVDYQFQKKMMRDQEQNARRMARAGGGSMLPMLGMGYAQTPFPAGQQLPTITPSAPGGRDPWGPVIPNAFGDSVTDMIRQGMDYRNWFGGAGGANGGANPGCFRTSTPGAPRVSPCREIQATGPDGKTYSWLYRGRPVLYSGDLAHCKRVNKILARAGRKTGKRFR